MKKLFLTLVLSISLFANAQKDSVKVDNFQKTDEVLSEVVKKALTVAEKTGDFVIEQAPLLLQEFYRWHIYSSIFFILFGILIYLFGRYFPNLWLSKESTHKYNIKFFSRYNNTTDSWDRMSASWGLFILTSLCSIIIIICNAYDLIYILVAPKLYLIDYFIK